MERSRFDLILERLIAGLVILVMVLGPLCTGMVRPQDFVYAMWLTTAAVGLWILRILCCQDHRLLWPPICYAAVAFALYAIWSYRQAPIEYLARQELLRVLVYTAIFLVFINNLHRQDLSQTVAFVMITLAMAISLYAVYQLVTQSDKVWWFARPLGYRGRGSGTYINPNHLAGLLEMILPMAIALTIAGRFGIVVKILLSYATLAILVGLIVTLSRGGWLAGITGAAFMFAFWLWQSQERRTPGLLIGALLIAVSATTFYFVRSADVRQQRLTQARIFGDVRLKVWPAAVAIWKENPWFGGGPNHFDARFPKYRQPSDQLAGRPERAHNDYLNTLADWGIVGASLIAAALAALAWGFFSGWRFLQRSTQDINANRNSTRAALALGSFSGVVAIAAHSVFDFNMHIPANAITAICLMGMVTGSIRFRSDRYWLPGSYGFRLLFVLPLLGWIYYVAPLSLRLEAESRELAAAAAPERSGESRLAHLKKAIELEPANSRTTLEIGEYYRREASEGASGNEEVAKNAKQWFERASELNPLDPLALIRQGMCLDWLDRPQEAQPKFEKALSLDPNGYNTVGHMGWHYFQIGNFPEAKKWLQKSQGLYPKENPLAYTYLRSIERKESEALEKQRREAEEKDDN